MKNRKKSHKKIGTLLLAGAIVMEGSVSSAYAISFRGQAQVSTSTSTSMIEFSKQERFEILEKKSSEEEMDKVINLRLSKTKVSKALQSLRQHLEKKATEIKNIEEFRALLKSGKRMHKIKVEDQYYLIRFDEVSVYAASKKSGVKFYNSNNQRNYDIMDYYSKKYGFEIVLVKDCSYYAGRVEMDALIRSKFKDNVSVRDTLLQGAELKINDAESLRLQLKSGNNIFTEKRYYRVNIGNLNYVIYKK